MIFLLGIFGVRWKEDSLWKGGKRNSVKIIRQWIKIVTNGLICRLFLLNKYLLLWMLRKLNKDLLWVIHLFVGYLRLNFKLGTAN